MLSKIGVIVRDTLPKLLNYEAVSLKTIQLLQDDAWCLGKFNMNFPVLKLVNNKSTVDSQRYEGEYARYYKHPVTFKGKKYLLCNDWYQHNKAYYINWFKGIRDEHKFIKSHIENPFNEEDYTFKDGASTELKKLAFERNLLKEKRNKAVHSKNIDSNLIFNKIINTNKRGSTWDKIRSELQNYFTDDKTKKKHGMVGEEGSNKVNFIEEEIKKALNVSVEHLSPNRNSQIRLFLNEDTSTDINQIINQIHKNPLDKYSFAHSFLRHWMINLGIGHDYRIKPIQGVASIIEIKDDNRKWVNLVDKGFGAGQLFCILLKIASVINATTKNDPRDNEPQIILIEEPEGNLHPKLQADLVDMLTEANQLANIRFVIETHSEYMIRKCQLLYKQSSFLSNHKRWFDDGEENYFEYYLTPKTYKIYYFDKEEGPYNMKFKEDGKFERKFGSGFFDKADELTMEAYKLKNKK